MGCPSPVGGDVALLIFVCSVIGAIASSNYVLEWSRWEWMRMNGSRSRPPTPPYMAWGSWVTIDLISEHIGFVVYYMECIIDWFPPIVWYDDAGYPRCMLISKLVDSFGLHGLHPSTSSTYQINNGCWDKDILVTKAIPFFLFLPKWLTASLEYGLLCFLEQVSC